MPFKSKAQQRFMFAAEERGDVPKGIAEEWAHKTKNIKKLPEHKKKASEIAPEVLLLLGTVLGGGAYLGYKASHKLQKVPKEASEIAGAEPGPPRPPDFSEDLENPKIFREKMEAWRVAEKEYWKTRTHKVQVPKQLSQRLENICNQIHNQSRLERKLRLGLLGATVLGGGAYLGYKALHKLQKVPKEASEIAGAVMRKEEAKNRPWWGAGIGGTLGGVLGALAGSSHSIRPRSGVGGLAGGLIGLGLGGAAGLGLGALSRHSHAVGNQKEARFLGDTAQSGLPYWKYGNPASDEAIRSVETQLAIAFPADYRAIVAQHNGGRPKPNAVDAPGKREVIMERLMSVDAGAKDNVAAATLVARKRHQSNLVPFASDPFGNLFCFQVAGKTPSAVVFWDHESGALTGICKTFPELLGMLHEPRR